MRDLDKILVCGGRDYFDKDVVFRVLDRVFPKMIIEGGAEGADTMARLWANSRGVHVATVIAQWSKLGKKAGPLRNEAMILLEPDLVLAFPGGRGTEHMVRTAKKANVPVTRVKPNGDTFPDD